MRFKIDWASLIVGRKFTIFALFSLYVRAIFQVQAPRELIVEGAYAWRGLFSEFYGKQANSLDTAKNKIFSKQLIIIFLLSIHFSCFFFL